LDAEGRRRVEASLLSVVPRPSADETDAAQRELDAFAAAIILTMPK
jgi:hypothetical protein